MSRLEPEDDVFAENVRLNKSDDEDLRDWLLKRLYQSFADARKRKTKTANEQIFEEDRDINLSRLADEIINRTYKPERSVAFIITKPTPREIFAASFRDRIVHHFLIQQVGNFWDKRFSSRSFSCRDGKGNLYGTRCLEKDIKKATSEFKDPWVMKIDLQGYFMSLSRVYLFERVCWGLEKQLPAGGPIYDMCRFLWSKIIFDDPLLGVKLKGPPSDWSILPPSKSMFNSPQGKGVVIGNLTSQWVSNMALDPLDRCVYFDLKCKSYGRYVDDAYFVADTKEELLAIRKKVTYFLSSIGLTVHPKKFYLQPASKGVSFLGVVVYPGRTVLGKRLRKNISELNTSIIRGGLSKKCLNRLVVYKGLSMHYNYKNTFKKIFGSKLLNKSMKWQYQNTQADLGLCSSARGKHLAS